MHFLFSCFCFLADQAHHVPDKYSDTSSLSLVKVSISQSQQTCHITNQTKQLQNSPKYTRLLSGDVNATSEHSSIDTNRKKISSNQKKSESSTSSPIMSPSIQQQKQYRTLNTQRSVELMNSTNDKENTIPVDSTSGIVHSQYGTAIDYRLDSPKFTLAEQNSPNTPLSSYKSPPSTHSSPMYTAHETPRSDCNIFTYSPLITEPFKNSTYFHFPDVDTPSPLTPAQQEKNASACMINNNNLIIGRAEKTNNSNQISNATNNNVSRNINNNNNNNINNNMKSSQTTPTLTADSCDQTDLLSVQLSNWPDTSDVGTCVVDGSACTPLNMHRLQIMTNDESTSGNCCVGGTKNKKEVRRARLKSISLDSDGARLVEENLCIPVEELVERTLPQTHAFDEDDTPFHSPAAVTDSRAHKTHTKCLSKNINRLVLDLSLKDNTLSTSHLEHQLSPNDVNDENFKSKATTPKTPTLTQTRQKAISLDSDPKSIEQEHFEPVQSTSTDFVGHPLSLHGTGSSNNSNMTILRNRPRLMANFLNVETNSSISVPTTPKRQQVIKSTLNKLNTNNNKMMVGKKMGFASSAEYFSSKKASEQRKCNEKLPDTEPIIEAVTSDYDDVYAIENDGTSSFETNVDDVDCDIICGSANSLLSSHGINNLTTGLRSNIGPGAGLSLSNYSLSNFQGSHCSLTRSNYNIFGMASSSTVATGQNLSKSNTSGSTSTTTNNSGRFINTSMQTYQQPIATNANLPFLASNSRNNFCVKKNLLQRRGSNTSLTLNIVGGANGGGNSMHHHSTLNRFNSHNSLNVMSTPFDVQRNNSLATAKKGLLERRNSNASLTLNIQKRALSTSNCYLRGSDLSLSSGGNNFESHLEEHRMCTMCGGGGILKTKHLKRSTMGQSSDENRQTDTKCATKDDPNRHVDANEGCEMQPVDWTNDKQSRSVSKTGYTTDTATSRPKVMTRGAGHRKFLSSENLNVHNTFSLCQPPIKTSSVVDLNQSNSEMLHSDGDSYDDQETTYCPCSTNIIRNITTKPLSPQTTSEDFKIYLANIQILQNASNILNDHQLTVLGHVFIRSYERTNDDKRSISSGALKLKRLASKLPSETEQNCLLTNLHQEFWDLPTNYQEKPLVFGSQVKNRYKTILPNEHSRVILDAEMNSTDPMNHLREQSTIELYINANYIKVSKKSRNFVNFLPNHKIIRFCNFAFHQGPDYSQNSYIATQGPMLNTIYDFWLMVYQNYKKNVKANHSNVDALPQQQKIAMLTDIIENDESKCAVYFPQNVGKFVCFMNNEERRHKDSQQTQAQLEQYFNEHDSILYDSIVPNEIHTETISSNENDGPQYHFNFFCIKTVDCINKNGYSIRKFYCMYHTYESLDHADDSNETSSMFNAKTSKQSITNNYKRELNRFVVYHYWFPHWPDHRSPENIDVVLDMCINLLDSDCEQEFLAKSKVASETDLLSVDENVLKSLSSSISNDEKTAAKAKDDGKPLLLSHSPFTGPIPIIHW